MSNFKGIKPGDRLTFRRPDGRIAAANVNPLLIFADHVVVNQGNSGTVVNERNYIGHRKQPIRRAKRVECFTSIPCSGNRGGRS